MNGERLNDATNMLSRISRSDASEREVTAAMLMPLVYDELRALAASFMRLEPPDHTLQPTALVHEAYLRLIDQTGVDWQGRAHFFAIAARMIRRVLIDHSRQRKSARRGGDASRTMLSDTAAITPGRNLDLLMLDDALHRLAELHPKQANVVEMRFFGGLTNDEVAHVLGVSRKTVVKHWSIARAWLSRELDSEPDHDPLDERHEGASS
jgi:RNA polymerase sigma-70 factor, ECF subfamily